MTVTLISNALANLQKIIQQFQESKISSQSPLSQPQTLKQRNCLPALVSARAFSDVLNRTHQNQMRLLMHAGASTARISTPIATEKRGKAIEEDPTTTDPNAIEKRGKKEAPPADPFQAFLQEMGKIPMLTAEQEITLGRQVQAMMPLMKTREELHKSIEKDSLDAESLKETKEKILDIEKQLRTHSGMRARKKMIKANLRLVVSIAMKYLNKGLEPLDLIQEGTLGLATAVGKFDPERGNKFSTCATPWIKQAIRAAIKKKSRTIYIPAHLQEKLTLIKKTGFALSQELGRLPTFEEIANNLHLTVDKVWTVDKVKYVIENTRLPVSLDKPIREGEDASLGDFIPQSDDVLTPTQFAYRTTLRDDLENLLLVLTPKQKQIFRLLHQKGLTVAEAAKEANVTVQRIRQAEEAIQKRFKKKGGAAYQTLREHFDEL